MIKIDKLDYDLYHNIRATESSSMVDLLLHDIDY